MSKYFDLKSPHELIKDLVLKDISWPTLKNDGYTREIYKKIKEFITNFNFESIVNKVKRELNCTDEEANIYINDYVDNIENFIDANTFGDKLLINLFDRSLEFSERCSAINQKNWEKKNHAAIIEAEEELNIILEEQKKYKLEIEKLNLEIKNQEDYIKNLENENAKRYN